MAEVARTSRGQLTNANLQSAIAEALDLVLAEFSAEEVGRWMPQISVWLWSDSRGEHGYTPLHNATEQGALEAVMWLISKGADRFARNDWDWTPLDLAVGLGEAQLVATLGGMAP